MATWVKCLPLRQSVTVFPVDLLKSGSNANTTNVWFRSGKCLFQSSKWESQSHSLSLTLALALVVCECVCELQPTGRRGKKGMKNNLERRESQEWFLKSNFQYCFFVVVVVGAAAVVLTWNKFLIHYSTFIFTYPCVTALTALSFIYEGAHFIRCVYGFCEMLWPLDFSSVRFSIIHLQGCSPPAFWTLLNTFKCKMNAFVLCSISFVILI